MRSVELLDPRESPDNADWSAFVREQRLPAYWSYALLAVASQDSRSPAVLAVMRDEQGVCGVLCAVVSGVGGAGPKARYPLLGFVDVRLLGSRATAWRFADRVDAATRSAFLRDFERAAYRRFGLGIRAVCYRAAPADDATALAGRVRPARPMVPDAVTKLDVSSLDGWLASLSKSRRADLRRQARIVREDPELVVRFGFRRTDLDAAQLATMVCRHTHRLAPRRYLGMRCLTPQYFAAVVDRDDVGILTYHDTAGRLLAFGTLFDSGECPVIGWWAALAIEEGGRKHLYFDHYLRLVNWSIEHGRRSISAGRGMFAVKATLGFAAVPMFLVAAPRGLR